MIDLRSWPKKWNDSGLRDFANMPEYSPARPWPLLGMLALGLAAGAAIGSYAVWQRSQMKQLASHANEMGDEMAVMGSAEADGPVVTSHRSNHRRKATLEV